MRPDRLLERFLRLVQIPSPSKQEGAVADYIRRWASRLRLPCRSDDAHRAFGGETGNLVVRVPAGLEKSLFLSAHMDVVAPCRAVRPRVRDGWIRSDGFTVLGADAKAGLAAAMETAECLTERRPGRGSGVLELVFTVGEELGLKGARGLDVSRLASPSGYVVDSQFPIGTAVSAAPSEETFEAAVLGRPAHAAVEPEKGVHAGLIAARAIAELPWGRLSPDTTANVGLIEGGLGTNVVMPSVRVEGELRSHLPEELAAGKRRIRRGFAEAAAERGGRVRVAFSRSYDRYRLLPRDPLLKALRSAAGSLRLPFRLRSTHGGSDANIFHEKGRPAVNLGYGAIDIHTCEERIEVADLELLARLLLVLAAPTSRLARTAGVGLASARGIA